MLTYVCTYKDYSYNVTAASSICFTHYMQLVTNLTECTIYIYNHYQIRYVTALTDCTVVFLRFINSSSRATMCGPSYTNCSTKLAATPLRSSDKLLLNCVSVLLPPSHSPPICNDNNSSYQRLCMFTTLYIQHTYIRTNVHMQCSK